MTSLPELKTERLILRGFRAEDAPALQLLAGEFEIADTTLNIPHPYPREMADSWIASHPQLLAEHKNAFFAVTLKADRQLIGAVGLAIAKDFDRAELGYWVGKPFWGYGYCTEAAAAVINFGFIHLSLHRIHASYLSRNPASGRVMEKLGMTREGFLRQHGKKWDKHEDLVFYGILRSDWAMKTP